jgi:phospholipid transport system substrate-binding protein
VLQDVSDELIQGLNAHKSELKTNRAVIYDLVKQVILPHIDTVKMTKSVLGRSGYQKFEAATPALQAKFTQEFTDLVIGTYVSALQSFDNQKIEIYPPRVPVTDQTRVRLNGKIITGQSPVDMSYVMQREGTTWQVIDFSVEGISLVQSYQSQFRSLLSNNGTLQSLVDTLQKHNDNQEDAA